MAEVEKGKAILKRAYDGWQNVLTGLGIQGKDKRMSASVSYTRFTEAEAEELYAADDMAAKIVDALPEEMMREGYDVKSTDETDDDFTDMMAKELMRLGSDCKFEEAMKWARMYGGSCIVMGINDGQDASLPVNIENIKSVDYLTLLSRWEIEPDMIQRDPEKQNFGEPETYRITPLDSQGATIKTVHYSRVLRFDGAKLPRRLYIANDHWHDSVLNRLVNVLRNFHTSHDSAASLLQDFAQGVYKLKNLTEMLSMGNDSLVQKRLALVDIVIEEGEEFDRKVSSLAGLPETLKAVDGRLVQAAQMPHTILLGESPSGLGATGNSEKIDWYDYVSRKQEIELKPKIALLSLYIMKAKIGPTKGQVPESWDVIFRPLWQLDEQEKATVNKTKAETDAIYISNGVLDPDEVAMSRFGKVESEIQIDLEARGESSEEEEEEAEEVDEENEEEVTDADSHIHMVEPGIYTGIGIPAFDKPGFHFHTSPIGITTIEKDGPEHKHKIPVTSQETDGPTLESERPDLKMDAMHSKKKKSYKKDFVEKRGEKWVVVSKSGKVLFTGASESEAKQRLKEIEYFKRKGN